MARGNITFNKSTAGGRRVAPGEDYISGLIFFGSGFTALSPDAPHLLYTIQDAEALGITKTTTSTYTFKDYIHYQISEFFRANPSGQLWIHVSTSDTVVASLITTVQKASVGKIRQMGICKIGAYSNADMIAIQTEVATNCDAKHMPLSVIYSGDLTATVDITTIPDLASQTDFKVSSVISQDGSGLGKAISTGLTVSCPNVGLALGMLSKSAVSEDFGQPVDKFNLSDGTENEVPAFANGQLISELSDNALDAIDAKRHIFMQKYVGYNGTYFNDNHTACALTSDYAYINDNRVIDKAIRGIYSALLPYLKSKLLKNSDGTLADATVSYLTNVALAPLYQMNRDGDLGAIAQEDVYIDPTQDVNNGTLTINVKLNENGIARNIVIPISFK